MARSYASIQTAIWRQDDWKALDALDQHLYFLLSTQPNISAAGALPLTVGRWSKLSRGSTVASVRAGLHRLAAAGLVALDEETEELLVRPFIRDDNGYRNRNRLPVIRAAAGEIESRTLRQALAVELTRLGLPAEWTNEQPTEPDAYRDAHPEGPPEGASEGPSGAPSDGVSDDPDQGCADPSEPLTGPSLDDDTPDGLFPQAEGASDGPSEGASDGAPGGTSTSGRVVVTKGPYVGGSSTHNPQSASRVPPPEAADARETRARRGTRLPADFAVTDAMKDWFAKNCPGVNGARETEKFRNHFSSAPGQKGVKLDWVATWRNWMLTAAERGHSASSRTTGANRHTDPRRDNPFAGGANATYASKAAGGAR